MVNMWILNKLQESQKSMGMYSRALRDMKKKPEVIVLDSLTQFIDQMNKEAKMAKKSPPLRQGKTTVTHIHSESVQRIMIDPEIVPSLERMASERGLTVEELINARLRAVVNAHDNNRVLSLSDPMPFGQYKGILVETMIRADPRYTRWLYGESEIFELDDEARYLLEELS